MADLIINGFDAFRQWGIRMGDGFLDAIFAPEPMKEFIENKSRLQHGKQVLYNNPKVDERDVTLVFTLEGSSPDDYLVKYSAFKTELQKGKVEIKVPVLGDQVYRFTYLRSASFGLNIPRTFSKISIKFNEPNPANRT